MAKSRLGVSGEKISLDNVGLAFGLVICAGLSTAVGAAAVFNKRFVKLASKPVLAAGLGFSAGVMLYVSFVEIYVKSQGAFLADGWSQKDAYLLATGCLFAGMALLRLIQSLVHRLDKTHHCVCDGAHEEVMENSVPPLMKDDKNAVPNERASEPQHVDVDVDADIAVPVEAATSKEKQETGTAAVAAAKGVSEEDKEAAKQKELHLMGIKTALAIGIHNFPEGLATFVGTLADPAVGVTLAVAIGIHNIPEGLCVALPIYYATDSRWKGFLWALLSGLSEPVGAFIGCLIIKISGEDMNQFVYGLLFGVVAGMMIMITILELLPTACKYDPTDKYVSGSVALGMVVMAASLCLFIA